MSSYVPSFDTIVKIRNPDSQPIDTVQEICLDPFNANNYGFLTGGWDGILRYGQIKSHPDDLEIVFTIFLEHPITAVAIGNNNIAFAGLCTGDIVAVDLSSNKCQVIGAHEAVPICKLFWLDNYSLLISLGFDQRLRFWNLSDSNGQFMANDLNLPFKTHSAAYDHPYLMIVSGDGRVAFMKTENLQNFQIPDQKNWFTVMEFGSKVTCASIKAKEKVYALGASDGRIFINYFTENYGKFDILTENSKKTYSKTQKRDSGYNSVTHYQVNDIDIGFQKGREYMVISGTEESAFLNILQKKKVRRYKGKITAGKITLDGRYFIFAEGNDWSEGTQEWKKIQKPQILAVKFTNTELADFCKSA